MTNNPRPTSDHRIDPEAPTLPPDAPAAVASEAATLTGGFAATPIPRPQVPGYEILAELGRGGMGVVYKARQVSLNRTVALKMLLAGAHAGEHDIARFRREAEAVARLHHPNVVHIHEIGTADGTPYFSFEFVEGGSLAARLHGDPMPADAAARLIETLARAVHAAHRQGIVHRDLKPANVLLTADGTPKIADFGLAKQVGSEKGQTRSGDVLGTPSYMAPEQAGGKTKQIGPAIDIYALGAILYASLTGRPPFQAETPLDTVLKVVSEEPVPPSRVRANLPRDLETICLKCLQKEPAKRYESAEAVADDLKRFLAGHAIHARPVRGLERAVRWARRHVVTATVLGALAAVVMTVLVAGAFVARFMLYPPEPKAAITSEKSSVVENNEPLPVDLALVPDGVVEIGTLHLRDLLNTDGAKRLQQRIVEEYPAWKGTTETWQDTAKGIYGFRPDEVERVTVYQPKGTTRALDAVAIVLTANPYDRDSLLRAWGANFRETKVGDRTYYSGDKVPDIQSPAFMFKPSAAMHFVNERVFVAGESIEALQKVVERSSHSDSRGDLRAVLAKVDKEKPHFILFTNQPRELVGDDTVNALDASFPQLAPLTNAESLTIMASIRSAPLAADGGDLVLLGARLAYRDEGQATAANEAVKAGLELAMNKGREQLSELAKESNAELFQKALGFDPVKLLNQLLLALHGTRIQRQGREVVIDLALPADLPKLGSGYAKMLNNALEIVSGAANRVKSSNNLKKLAVAMHNYHDAVGRFPPEAIVNKDGKPLLSWRVALLPFLEQDELFRQFKIDEPWDSPHNIKLLEKMPPVFVAPGREAPKPTTTWYRVFVGPGTAFDGNKGLEMRDFTDGTSNTILIVEAGDDVPWTKPDELAFEADKPLPEVGGLSPDGFNAAFADGLVRFIKKGVKPDQLRLAITRNDGRVFNLDE